MINNNISPLNFIGDSINKLPIDNNNNPSHQEIHNLNLLFPESKIHLFQQIFNELKDSILIMLLFIIFSLPQFDVLLEKILPITKTSIYINLLIRAILMAIVWWLIKYFYLSRKNK